MTLPRRLSRPIAGLLLAGGVALVLPACSAAPAGGNAGTTSGANNGANSGGTGSATGPNMGSSMSTPASRPASGTLNTQATTPGATEAGCNAQAVQDLVGRHASSLIAEGARQRAGAQRVRMIGHDEMVTKEYDAGRLNLQLDAQGRVARVYCG